MLYPLSYRGWNGSGYRTAPWPHRPVADGTGTWNRCPGLVAGGGIGSAAAEDPGVDQGAVQGEGLAGDPFGGHVVLGAHA